MTALYDLRKLFPSLDIMSWKKCCLAILTIGTQLVNCQVQDDLTFLNNVTFKHECKFFILFDFSNFTIQLNDGELAVTHNYSERLITYMFFFTFNSVDVHKDIYGHYQMYFCKNLRVPLDQIWNSLPRFTRQYSSLHQFKCNYLKRYSTETV